MFFYKSEEIDNNQRINLKVKDKLVSEVLSEITKNNNLTYKITGKHIIITKATTSSQAPRKITGVITDENGEPIIGANVVEKGPPMEPLQILTDVSLWMSRIKLYWLYPILVMIHKPFL